jgi:hypothetical protein
LKNAETRMVTDVTGSLPSVRRLKNAETRMVTDATTLQGKICQYEKTSSHEIADDPNNTPEGEPLTDLTPVTTIVTPTFEPSAKPCNNSKICKESHPSEPGTIAQEEPSAEPTAQAAPPIASRVNWNPGDQVKASAQYPGAFEYKGERATVVKVRSDGLCRIELDREISVLEGKPKKQFNLNVRYLVSEFAADSNLNEEELELVNEIRGAIKQSDPLVTDAVKKSLTETCDKGLANRQKVWGALRASERTVFKALLACVRSSASAGTVTSRPRPLRVRAKNFICPNRTLEAGAGTADNRSSDPRRANTDADARTVLCASRPFGVRTRTRVANLHSRY